MLRFKTSHGLNFSAPEGWADVTLNKFLISLNLPDYPEQLKRMLEGEKLSAAEYGRFVLPYFVKIVSFWVVGLSENDAAEMNEAQLRQLFFLIQKSLSLPQNLTYSDSVDFEGTKYYLPVKHMKKSTVAEFVDAAQLEHHAAELGKNNYSILPELCAMLLRKKGEIYNKDFEEITVPKRKKLFLNLTMDKVFEVCFFLLKQSEQLGTILNLSLRTRATQ